MIGTAEMQRIYEELKEHDAILKTTYLNEEIEKIGADGRQIGGVHYKNMPIQPWYVMESVLTPEEFIGFLKGNIIKYSMRSGHKGPDDAEKARHYQQKLREIQNRD